MRAGILAATLAIAAGSPTAAAEEQRVLEVGAFSRSGGELPEGWEPLLFPKIKEHTRYELVKRDGVWVVRAESRAAASGLRRAVRVDLHEYPILRWRWKIENTLEKGNVRERAGDDYPARVYVSFEYQPERVGLTKRIRYLAARTLRGDLPIGALTYIWASHARVGDSVPNAYAGNFVRMIVVQSGASAAGEWQSEERDVYADYRRAFGDEPPPVCGVALMTDTDNTGESAVAWYGDIAFLRRDRATPD